MPRIAPAPTITPAKLLITVHFEMLMSLLHYSRHSTGAPAGLYVTEITAPQNHYRTPTPVQHLSPVSRLLIGQGSAMPPYANIAVYVIKITTKNQTSCAKIIKILLMLR